MKRLDEKKMEGYNKIVETSAIFADAEMAFLIGGRKNNEKMV